MVDFLTNVDRLSNIQREGSIFDFRIHRDNVYMPAITSLRKHFFILLQGKAVQFLTLAVLLGKRYFCFMISNETFYILLENRKAFRTGKSNILK